MAGREWTQEARDRWKQKSKELHAARKGGAGDPLRSGGDRPASSAGGGSNGGGAGIPGGGSGGEKRRGVNLIGGRTDKGDQGKAQSKAVIDLDKLKAGLPNRLIKVNRGMDGLARAASAKGDVEVYFEELTPDEAKMDAEFLWPFLDATMPEFLRRHPFLAVLFVFVADVVGKLRWRKRKKELNNGTKKQEQAPGQPEGPKPAEPAPQQQQQPVAKPEPVPVAHITLASPSDPPPGGEDEG